MSTRYDRAPRNIAFILCVMIAPIAIPVHGSDEVPVAGDQTSGQSTGSTGVEAQTDVALPVPTAAAQTGVAGGSVQSTSGMPQEATRPNAFFPPWSLRSTRGIDPRVRPNAGLRIPLSYFPIAGGPLLYPNFSPVEPDFVGGQPTSPWAVRTSIGLFGVGDDHVSAKFQEFRDVRNGATAGVEGHYRTGNTVFNLFGRQIGRRDQDLTFDGGEAGFYLYGLSYSETPHNYAFDVKSLYSGFGTRALTLPDAMQADLQTSTTLEQLSAKMLGYVFSGAQSVDMSLQRQSLAGDFTLLAKYPFTVRASVGNESRSGVRPWSGSFGFGNFVEIPWPVKYDTHEFRISGEYSRPESPYYGNLTYRYSNFVNHIQSFTFDNPDRIVDAAGNLNCTFNCGPAMGRMSLYPTNKYHEFSGVFAAKKLPLNSTFNAVVSIGLMRQDERLVPYSTNSVTVVPMRSPVNPSFNATDPAGLPRQSAETAMNTTTASLRWTSELTEKVRLVGQYRYNGLDNNENPFVMYEFVREDEDIRRPETAGGTYAAVLAAWAKHTAALEGTYEFTPFTKVSGVYTWERMNRDHREVERMTDNRLKVEFDTLSRGWIELKSWYERSNRKTSVYEFNHYNIVQGNQLGAPMFPWLEKFDEAPFDRNEAQAMATFAFNDVSTVSTHVQWTSTDYDVTPLGPISMAMANVTEQTNDDFQFGVRWDRRLAYGIDYTFTPTPRLSVFVDAGLETIQYESMSRQWTVNGISDPYRRERVLPSNSNWIAKVRDNYYTSGIGVDATLIPEKLKASLQYSFGRSDGRHLYSSPVGTAVVNDTNAFEPQPFYDVDDTKTHSLNPEVTYEYSDRLSVAAGYLFEKWQVDDYNYKGFTYAPRYINGVALLMGAFLPREYSQNVAYVRVRMGF